MHIVTTGVHHRHLAAGDRVDLRGSGGVVQPRFFFNRQAIHIGAHHYQGTFAIFQYGHHAGTANFFGHFKTALAQFIGKFFRGFGLHKTEFGIAVKMGK